MTATYPLKKVSAALSACGAPEGRQLASDHPCEGSRYHSPTPLLTTALTIGDDVVTLCSACMDNLRAALHLRQHALNKTLDWSLRLEMGNPIRALYERCIEAKVEEI